jgi:GTP-binding protein
MYFVDEAKLNIKAGKGGDGVVRWRHEKYKEFGGPSGGNGGKGGDVYFVAIRDLNKLVDYKNKHDFFAEDGEEGGSNSREGKNGIDLEIEVPVGSIVTKIGTKDSFELIKEREKVLVLSGGKGGFGNEHFKSSNNTTPKEFTLGKEGEIGGFYIELKLMADAGFIGFPNAGKSSLLNELTNAKPKIGSYEFTTLDPNLGDLYGFILADIPGLIEGASEGRGLGHKFLRHISRVSVLIHCISLENEDIEKAYETIRKEMDDYDSNLSQKQEIIVLTKTDLISKKDLEKLIKKVSKLNERVFTVSIYDDESIKKLHDSLIKFLREIKKK